MTKDEALKLALEALEQLTDTEQTYGALDLGDSAIAAVRDALAQPQEANNFCPRCGKRTPDPAAIHTCTPPRGLELT